MDLKFSCGNCGQHLAIDESCAGRWIKCPACDKPARAPGERVESLSKELAAEHAVVRKVGTQAAVEQLTGQESRWKVLSSRHPWLAPLQRVAAGWGVGALILALLFLGANLFVEAALPKGFSSKLTEAYRVGELREQLGVNHAGSALLYGRNLERGEGVFILNLTTLKSQRLGLADGADTVDRKSFSLIGWSPDDAYVAFSLSIGNGHPNQHIVICDGANGTEVSAFDLSDSMELGAWLNSVSIVMLDHSHRLHLYNIKPSEELGKFGKQGQIQLLQLKANASSFALCVVSPRSIAFSDAGNLWFWDFSEQPSQMTHLINATPKWIDYDPVSDRFLFCSQNGTNGDAYVYRFDPKLDSREAITQLSDNISYKPQWLAGGKGFSYIGTEANMNFLAIEAADNSLRTNLFLGGHLRGYSVAPQEDKVYAVASRDAGPLSVWEYDVSQKTLRVVVPTKEPSANFQIVAPVTGVVTNEYQQRVDYYVLVPPNLVSGKKYPVLIDQTADSRYDPNTELIANCGIFYASVNRYGLASSEKRETALVDSLALYKELIKDPRIDSTRIYLSGRSAAAIGVSELVDYDPQLWRGIVLLSPGGRRPHIGPDTKQFPSVFMSIGDEDELVSLAKDEAFAEEAYRHNIPVWIICSHSGHNFRGTDLAKERFAGVVKFICADF
jgi:dienelactone hydrolase